eukprot:Skav226428  [mRNA]  locus=scaffold2653:107820:113588:+ [translate_table: standard]
MPSLQFLLRKSCGVSGFRFDAAKCRGSRGSCGPARRELEMKRPSELPEKAGTVEHGSMSVPLLGRNSIRFARNHDTVCNDVTFYGLTNWSQASAQVAAAWLLATHDGSVLLLADDALRTFIDSLTVEQRQTIRTEVRVKEAEDGGRPLTICVAVRVDAGHQQL